MTKFNEIEELDTERSNPKTLDIDILKSMEIAKIMNAEDKMIALAVEKILEPISKLAEKISDAIKNDGRCIYVGAGTSGRVAMIDAVETVPTFNLPVGTFTTILAGGPDAMIRSLENVEDDWGGGAKEIEKAKISSKDVVIGISASGRTPFVMGAIEKARQLGALTGSISNVSNAKLSSMVDIPMEVVTGPEVVTGSTRLKAGTAQKMVLNMLSTISMIRLGKVYKNLMVDLTPINEKLVIRAINIIVNATGVSKAKAEELLRTSGMRPKVAIIMALTNSSVKEAEELLKRNSGSIRNAINKV